jgi:hypothetical protein
MFQSHLALCLRARGSWESPPHGCGHREEADRRLLTLGLVDGTGLMQLFVCMANHKRKGPKSTRAGCLLCKPHKHQAEHRRDRTRGDRRWREQQVAAEHDGHRDRSRSVD